MSVATTVRESTASTPAAQQSAKPCDDPVLDPVQAASEASFPASDPPSWIASPPPPPSALPGVPVRLCLDAKTAADFKSGPLAALSADAPLQEITALLTDYRLPAVPVIDEAGKPLGIISHYHLLGVAREQSPALTGAPGRPTAGPDTGPSTLTARDVMTPGVFSVMADAPARRVLEEMLAMRILQVFLVDETGVLVGSVSALDVLRALRFEDPHGPELS